ncbi:MAG: hypothetical protein KDB37_08300 [Ilumatobacter sp.]|nr:hypothetical protein [Ilumatobacter sp.]
MAEETTDTGKKNYTAPKGRPTRTRDGHGGDKRVFGPVAQWITVAILIIVAITILLIVTDGGDFNPFDDEGNLTGAPAAGTTELG